ncbi:MAG: ATP-binding protein [Pseudomonadota bacterium]|nr:ATP-binding protein [Pseudomonadota bacterium]
MHNEARHPSHARAAREVPTVTATSTPLDGIKALIRGGPNRLAGNTSGENVATKTVPLTEPARQTQDGAIYADAVRFCRAVLPTTGNLCVQRRAGTRGLGRPEWFSGPDEAAKRALELDSAEDSDVYLAIASYTNRHGRTAAEVARKRSLYLDLDVGEGKPFQSQAAAVTALKEFCERCQLPFPAILVNSGKGWHVHWPLIQEISPEEWRTVAANLRFACEIHNFPADHSVTTDITRVLRVPGTRNHKSEGEPVAVKLAHFKDPHDFSTLSIPLSAAAKTRRAPSVAVDDDDLKAGIPSADDWFDALSSKEQSTELRNMVAALPHTAADDRGEWIKTLAEVASAKNLPWDERVDIAWEFSQQSQKSDSESRASIDRLMKTLGEQTCVSALRNRSAAYGYCPTQAPYSDIRSATAGLVRQYAYLSDQDVYFDIEKRRIVSKSSLKDLEYWRMPQLDSGRTPDPIQVLRAAACTQRCDTVAFHPGEGAIFHEDGQRVANLFRPAPSDEITPTRCERILLLRFLRHLFPRGTDLSWLRHLLDTYAYLVQRPGERVSFMMILVGEVQGSGKSTLMEQIPRLLFGHHNVATVSTHELESQFTDWLANAWIVVFAEVSLGRSREAARIANALKDNQTNARLRIIEKGRPGRTQRNRVSFLGTSNDETHALHLSPSDRRAGICAIHAPLMPSHLAFDLYNFLQSQRAPGVLRYLARRRDVQRFNPNAAPPASAAKLRMIEESRDPAHAEILEAWTRREAPFDKDLVTIKEVGFCLANRGVKEKTLSDRRIGQYLRDAPINAQPMEHQVRLTKQSANERVRIWVLRNMHIWRHQSSTSITRHLMTGERPLGTSPTQIARSDDDEGATILSIASPPRSNTPTVADVKRMRAAFESGRIESAPSLADDALPDHSIRRGYDDPQ